LIKSLSEYIEKLGVIGKSTPDSTEIFAKILTPNDDSGRHGVLIPNEAYPFFPELPIPDPSENATVLFPGVDAIDRETHMIGWKYYQRYPERRVTRLNRVLNETAYGRRLLIVIHYDDVLGKAHYVTDACIEGPDPRFDTLLDLLFGTSVPTTPGAFVRRPIEGPSFSCDQNLNELLEHFDRISAMGWIDSLRSGDTGIGYTFETLAGIEENNDKRADFKGIEIKCKLRRDGTASGKINLFQQAPIWTERLSASARLKLIGQLKPDGTHACYSQVTTTPNNLGLRIDVTPSPGNLYLRKQETDVGYWTRDALAQRLAEKHARAVFVKADFRRVSGKMKYHYVDVVYCERPDIDRFIDLVDMHKLVFEFAMYERLQGGVRNHGYPWRLNDESFFNQLYALQVQLRGVAK
jgi:hypothetical protein